MKRSIYLTFVVLMVFGAVMTVGVHAQVTGTVNTPVPLDLAGKIMVVAGVVASALQGIKKFLPSISGNIAVLMNVVLSLATTYAAHSTLDIQYFLTALGAALAAAGIYDFVGPQTPPAAIGK